MSPLHKKNSVALWLREKICCSRKIKRLKAARIIAQRQVRGNANGALGLRTNKIRPVRTKEKKSVYSVRSRKIENSVLKNANQCSIAPRSCRRANASFPRRGITNPLPGAATRFARLPRAMVLLRFQRVFLPFLGKVCLTRGDRIVAPPQKKFRGFVAP